MARWMLLALEEGSLDGTEVLDDDIWRDTTTSQFTSGDGGGHRKPFYPAKKESMNYGLGWQTGDYRGDNSSSITTTTTTNNNNLYNATDLTNHSPSPWSIKKRQD